MTDAKAVGPPEAARARPCQGCGSSSIYTCPSCGTCTCSLACSKQHKIDTGRPSAPPFGCLLLINKRYLPGFARCVSLRAKH